MIHELTPDEMMGTLQVLVRVHPHTFGKLSALELFELFYDIELRDFLKAAYQIDGFITKVSEYWDMYKSPVLSPIYSQTWINAT